VIFLVTGATGNVGPELISILLERGHAVRAVVRDRVAPLDRNVEAFVGDLNAAETLRPALARVDGVFLLSGYDDAVGRGIAGGAVVEQRGCERRPVERGRGVSR
jgi:uncharacterized protein YbjT (DUF2867 family)